jgi:hypothetical protein
MLCIQFGEHLPQYRYPHGSLADGPNTPLDAAHPIKSSRGLGF